MSPTPAQQARAAAIAAQIAELTAGFILPGTLIERSCVSAPGGIDGRTERGIACVGVKGSEA